MLTHVPHKSISLNTLSLLESKLKQKFPKKLISKSTLLIFGNYVFITLFLEGLPR